MMNYDLKTLVNSSQTLTSFMSHNGIEIKLITPLSPWQGGIYERLVGLVKNMIYKTIGTSILPFLEMETLIIEVEGILNSRPITPCKKDILDLPAIRPIDFIVPNVKIAVPEATNSGFQDAKYYLTENWSRNYLEELGRIKEKLWDQFAIGYYTTLREYKLDKKHHAHLQPKVGHVVLIDTQTILQRHKWPLGVITSIKRSIDGQPQSVMVRCGTKELEKSVNQLIPLEDLGLPAEDLNEEEKSKSVPPQIESKSFPTILPTKTPDTLLRKRGRPPGSKNKPKDSTNQGNTTTTSDNQGPATSRFKSKSRGPKVIEKLVNNGQKTPTHNQSTSSRKANKKQAEEPPAPPQLQGKEDRSRPYLPRKAKICTPNNGNQDTQPTGENQSISPKEKMFGSSAPGVSRPSYGRSQPENVSGRSSRYRSRKTPDL
ncbi:hypothetical protein CRE_15175 [Caenorhabditis remanei]|uniref:Integrase catalytic domain-containing protein n=1 Tax=Caenorhabditis remanei TaxID=31234 RepID=E3NNP2_CAERE|nr:hypothetical protein CRE_15175 [Caenorhabditis remanei]